jgi:hypothetical protein
VVRLECGHEPWIRSCDSSVSHRNGGVQYGQGAGRYQVCASRDERCRAQACRGRARGEGWQGEAGKSQDAQGYRCRTTTVKGGSGPVEIAERDDFDDYRDVDGLKFAYKWTSNDGGRSTVLELKTVEVNPEVDLTLFDKPATK